MEITISKSIENLSQEEKYILLKKQSVALLQDETDVIANMANLAALIKQTFNWFWVGFYISNNNDELVLGPFQGPVACTRIPFNKGVCGKSATEQKTIIVDDVNKFPGHIACNNNSKSEIVVPFVKNNQTKFVLDIDHDIFSSFNSTDSKHLTEVVQLLSKHF